MITLATEKSFGLGSGRRRQLDCRALLQASTKDRGLQKRRDADHLVRSRELWLARFAWSEMYAAPLQQWHLDRAFCQVGGMFTDSRGIWDALTRSKSPQLRLRCARTGEARAIKEQCPLSLSLFQSEACIHCVGTLTTCCQTV